MCENSKAVTFNTNRLFLYHHTSVLKCAYMQHRGYASELQGKKKQKCETFLLHSKKSLLYLNKTIFLFS